MKNLSALGAASLLASAAAWGQVRSRVLLIDSSMNPAYHCSSRLARAHSKSRPGS